MKLSKFLESARAAGHSQLRIVTPRGQTIYRGTLDVSAEDVEARCLADAETLAGNRRHEYIVHVETDDGRKCEQHTVRVEGGERSDLGHVVDPHTATSPAAVVGHLTRALIDAVKQNTVAMGHIRELAMKVAERDSEENQTMAKELGKLRRASMRHGDVEALRILVEKDQKEQAANGEVMRVLGQEAMGFLKLTMGRVSPDAAAAALAQLKESFSDEQHANAAELFGAATWGRILACPSPERTVDLFMSVDPEKFQAFALSCTDAQQQLVQGALASAFSAYQQKKTNGAAGAAKEAAS